jgi:hypothetical protein
MRGSFVSSVSSSFSSSRVARGARPAPWLRATLGRHVGDWVFEHAFAPLR